MPATILWDTGEDYEAPGKDGSSKSTLEPLNSGPLNSGKPLINRQARLD